MEEKGPCCENQHTQSACKLNKINDLRTYCVINMCQNDIQTPQIPFIFDIRKPLIRKVVRIKGFTRVEVAGFEPAAFWSRTAPYGALEALISLHLKHFHDIGS